MNTTLDAAHDRHPLPVIGSPRPHPGPVSDRPSPYTPWRVATLAGVYLLMGIHIAHWRLNGSTLAPLELNEVMYTLELGVVTAGFLFMLVAFVATAIFGRFFCGWACHILALEDLAAWLLAKVRIRPRPVRSRVLLLVPPAALFYMFIWPQIDRVIRGDPLPRLHLLDDAGGWASFVTSDFWRNLPGPMVALLTFAVCGFLMIYVLGSRSFCSYACPYGVLFGLADRVAPGRIRVDPKLCVQCGHCTAVCDSHVRVHEEIAAYGSVVDPWCLKDMDCVNVCPENALSYGVARPSLLRSVSRTGRRRLRYDFSLGEDLLMAGVFLATLLIFRGLYGQGPFLMALGAGGICAYLAVVGLRLVRRPNVRLNNFQLRLSGRLTRTGRIVAGVLVLLGAFVVHSGVIRYHEFAGDRAYAQMRVHLTERQENPPAALVAESLAHARFVERFGLVRPPDLDRRLASLHLFGDPAEAEPFFLRHLQRHPDDQQARLQYAESLARTGRGPEAETQLRLITQVTPSSPEDAAHVTHFRVQAREILGSICASRRDFDGAIREYEIAVAEDPGSASAHMALGSLLRTVGRNTDADKHFRRVDEIRAESADR